MADLPPGPELDALVAEKVMGWPEYNGTFDGLRWRMYPATAHRSATLTVQRSATLAIEWSPSTNIAHAWEVLERMKDHHEFHIENDQGEAREWIVSIQHLPSGNRSSAEGETAAYAICLAAAEAVGHE